MLRFIPFFLLGGAIFAAESGSNVSIQSPVGWRGKGNGCLPAADIVSEWDGKTGKNIVWKTPMPNWGNSSPICVGDKVFTMSEPLEGIPLLLCLDAKTGKTLWQQEIDHLDTFPAAEREAGKKAWREVYMVDRTLTRLDGILSASDIKAPPSEEAKTLADSLKLTITTYNYKWEVSKKDPVRREYSIKARDVSQKYGWYFPDWWGPQWTGQWVGFTFPTPVSDGTSIYVVTQGPTIACFGLDGTKRWMKWFGQSIPKDYPDKEYGRGGTHHASSPVLVDGKLIVKGGRILRALNPANGDLLWEKIDYRKYSNVNSPVGLKLKDTWCVINGTGNVFRVSDGLLMGSCVPADAKEPLRPAKHDQEFPLMSNVTPAVDREQGIVYFTVDMPDGRMKGTFAIKLTLTAADKVESSLVWRNDVNALGNESPVLVDGKLFSASCIYDLKTGQKIGDMPPANSMSLLASGTRIVSGVGKVNKEGEIVCHVTDSSGKVLGKGVLLINDGSDTPERQRLIQEMTSIKEWGRAMASPGIGGNRIFLRLPNYLYCIGNPQEPFKP